MGDQAAAPRVVRNGDEGRYELWVGDQLAGLAEYLERGERTLFTHTEVADAFGGQGLGKVLAREALDDTVRRQRVIVPLCSFIADFVGKRPEYASHVEGQRGGHGE